MNKLPILLVAGLLLSSACASVQKVKVESQPEGASVTLVKLCQNEISGSIAGVGATGVAGECRAEPVYIGTTPLEYEFPTEESVGGASVPGAGVSVERRYTEGILRAEKNGAFAEQRIAFTGKPIEVNMSLVAAETEAVDATADEAAAGEATDVEPAADTPAAESPPAEPAPAEPASDAPEAASAG